MRPIETGNRRLAVLLVILTSVAASQEPPRPPVSAASAERSVTERIKGRTFPSVFQAWSPAQNIRDESPLHTVARHDLIWHGPQFFGLRWNNKYTGLADGFTPESIRAARLFRQRLLMLNPNLV